MVNCPKFYFYIYKKLEEEWAKYPPPQQVTASTHSFSAVNTTETLMQI